VTKHRGHVVFSHGKESGPWGRKISLLADVAKAEGYLVDSVDYRGIDDPDARVLKLVEACREKAGDLILVGSSLGGYVATAACGALHAQALFLMAPALYVEGLKPLRPNLADCQVGVVHGWRDELIPVEHSIRFAQEHRAMLMVLDTDHVMHDRVRAIYNFFEFFLIRLAMLPQHPV
jgi:predicted esterase